MKKRFTLILSVIILSVYPFEKLKKLTLTPGFESGKSLEEYSSLNLPQKKNIGERKWRA